MIKMRDLSRKQGEAEVTVNAVGEETEGGDDWTSNWDLSHLTSEQQKPVLEVLNEFKDLFSRNESDIGDISVRPP